MVTATFPEDYGYALFSIIIIAFHCTIQGYRNGRGRILNINFIRETLLEENTEYNELFGHDIQKGGYPDMGDGRFAAKLPFKEWLKLSVGQRAHQNYVEGLPLVLSSIAVAGLKYPIATAIMSLVYVIGREIYCIGYRRAGPKGRFWGEFFFLPLLGLFGLAAYTSLSFTRLFD